MGVDPHVGLLSAAAAVSSRHAGILAGHYMSSSTSSPSSSTTPPTSSSAIDTSASSPTVSHPNLNNSGSGVSHTSTGHQTAWHQPSLDSFSSAAYNGQQAMAAAQAAARESYFGSHWASSLGTYAANANANAAMMNYPWNSYSLAAYQGLQREGVTYGKLVINV